MRRLIRAARLDEIIFVDSAGTAAFHVGELPDARSRRAANARATPLEHRARAFRQDDFDRFDLVLAMDRQNLTALRELASNEDARAKIELLRAYDPTAPAGAEVPDPYYGGARGFEEVLDIAERACEGLLARLRERHAL